MDGVVAVMDDKSAYKDEMRESRNMRCKSYDMGLRMLGFGCCLAAAVITGVNKETEIVSVSLSRSLPPFKVPVTAKWFYMSSFVYFVASNSIACAYAATSVALSIVARTKPYDTTLLFLILDLVMMALLFSANGAATFIGLIALKGNSHLQWRSVCGIFGGFCKRTGASLALSWFGSFVFFLLVVLAALNLHKRLR